MRTDLATRDSSLICRKENFGPQTKAGLVSVDARQLDYSGKYINSQNKPVPGPVIDAYQTPKQILITAASICRR